LMKNLKKTRFKTGFLFCKFAGIQPKKFLKK
jgi:hypothetical protein